MRNIIKAFSLLAFAAGLGVVSPEFAHAEWENCTPVEVLEFSNRVHVRCSARMTVGTVSTIEYIAVPTSNTAVANRFVALANAALISGKTFRVDLPTTASTTVSACAASNCRTPLVFGIID